MTVAPGTRLGPYDILADKEMADLGIAETKRADGLGHQDTATMPQVHLPPAAGIWSPWSSSCHPA